MKYVCKLEEIEKSKCIDVDGQHYYFVKSDGSIRMFSLICPHMGGIVELKEDLLICPVHKWKFDAQSGKSIVGSKDLEEIDVKVEGGNLFADIEGAVQIDKTSKKVTQSIEVKMLSHACLQFQYQGFSLLTDPWLDGPAFHGAWTQYPAPAAKPSELNPDVLLITHEHSDHCHVNSLRQFDRSLPIYFPAFPNQRIDHLLRDLGFKNLHPMIFGREYSISSQFKITCYSPTSNWNDSIQLIDIAGYRVLNLNDAGVNHKIAKEVLPVDLICSSFGSGASAYPMCWTHLSRQVSENILADQFQAKRDMLVHSSKLYQCSNILLFASYFALWHPRHVEHQKVLTQYKITPQAIKEDLGKVGVKVIDILPGDKYLAKDDVIERNRKYGAEVFSWDSISAFIKASYDEEVFEKFYPKGYSYDEERVINYFLSLQQLPEIFHVTEYYFTLKVIDSGATYNLNFGIKDQSVFQLGDDEKSNLHIEIPCQLLMHLIKCNLSWDEVYIGYWCKFHNENPYNVAFWRLLQAPYHVKSQMPIHSDPNQRIHAQMTIGEVLDEFGEIANRIMNRNGLYCMGCERAPQESLEQGARKHGLNPQEVFDLIEELNQATQLDLA